MDRKSHKKHDLILTPAQPYVDNYLQGIPRFQGYDPYPPLNTGLTRPIYDIHGNIQFSLPLEHYPPVRKLHREIITDQFNFFGNFVKQKL